MEAMYPAHELRDRLRSVLHPEPQPVLPESTRMAAVLIPVLAAGDEPRVVFTRRTDTLSRHPGEISFPGGLVDPGERPVRAALREAEEELGLRPNDVEVVGGLESVHTSVSGILMVPFVGILWRDPLFTPNPGEIAEVLEYPLAGLAASGAEEEFEYGGRTFRTFVYDMDGHVIWGATARILWNFIGALQRTPLSAET
jgi:8-oxo-dGTP pyrophosphatase MutT (NUDIX family)